MKSHEIRQQFLDFFKSKQHKIVPSAPLVNKDDPTLMFVNAGMNPFKDYFLGNKEAEAKRVADTQKCLRVSGKHNDLEDVGVDGYHHTMFEMLGNWSFGDYFKEEAIDWAWELLTEVYKLPKDRLYATYFEGDASEDLDPDSEAENFWKKYLPEDRILKGNKKDNFWEMGETGPCGPCSELHIDIRSDEDRQKVSGRDLVNMDDPEVIEIWNLVFIQYERKADNSLVNLPAKHIDTGMGFERIVMALQGKKASYDTDVFTPLISFVEKATGIQYGGTESKADMAFRVIVDHIRAVGFTIADGQLPSNTGAGYVIRRILRRAVRYYYSFLNTKQPMLYKLLEVLAEEFKDVFPNLHKQLDFVQTIILKEEESFLRTLGSGIDRLTALMDKATDSKAIDGRSAFELFDTYGFPFDLTRLILSENGYTVDEDAFNQALKEQRERSKKDAVKQVGDWMVLDDETEVSFVGYDKMEVDEANVLKYRTVKVKKKEQYQIVLDITPFYAESGGQRGDKGLLWFGEEKIAVIDTQKENDLIIHIVNKFPENINSTVKAAVDTKKRNATSKNHTAAHLMHAAFHEVLGEHAVQKGQDVDDKRMRFDFSHFQKVTEEEIERIESIVNTKIRENIALDERRAVPIKEAEAMGAMMLFGEKYGETVRVITFDKDFSQELCGGTHVSATGEIGLFKITVETSVAAGVRRIEAVTADGAEAYLKKELGELKAVRDLFKNPKHLAQNVQKLQDENKALQREIESLQAAQANALKANLLNNVVEINGTKTLITRISLNDSKALKTLAYNLEKEIGDVLIVFGAEIKGKPQLMVTVSESLTTSKELHAGNIVRGLAKHIKGGGGGQPFFATAGGKDASGLDNALAEAKTLL